jgi:preprotein translocase subunit YajC/vacuolar-type H+-ATPase subunit H
MLINFLKKHVLTGSTILVATLIALSVVMVFYNRQIMAHTSQVKELSSSIVTNSSEVQLQGLVNYDKNLRGYGLSPTENFIGHIQYNVNSTRSVSDSLVKRLKFQKELMPEHQAKIDSFINGVDVVKSTLKDYHTFGQTMVDMMKQDSTEAFRRALEEDRGAQTWSTWNALHTRLESFENSITRDAQKSYDTAAQRNLWIQLLLLFLGLPTLFVIIRTLRIQEKTRKSLLVNLQETNRKYLFHPSQPQYQNIIEESIENLQKAATFITRITQGEDAKWEGLDESNLALNEHTLVGELIRMQQRMKEVKREDMQRNWTNEGLNFMGEILRMETDIQVLTNRILSELIKYVNANQGAIFILNDTESTPYLELKAMYAYNRKKYQTGRVEIGEGLAGQVVLEKETIYLTEVPDTYVKITSGLGMANPNCILIVPMNVNDRVQGVIEIASFEKLEPYKVNFIEKLAEQMASAVVSARTNEKTKQLLEASQEQAEEMRAQEEEMRQNMEELAATQEEMFRKEQEYVTRIQELEESLHRLQSQLHGV